MQKRLMNLKILLPFHVFARATDVLRIVAHTEAGSFSLFPHRPDCTAALAPGILSYETQAEGEVHVAVDQGVLIKIGQEVVVSVRRAMAGADLAQLREAVEKDFLVVDKQETHVRSLLAKLDSSFLGR